GITSLPSPLETPPCTARLSASSRWLPSSRCSRPVPALAQGTPRSIGECERLKNDLAYNQCLGGSQACRPRSRPLRAPPDSLPQAAGCPRRAARA
ncbi:hypothetical protein CTI14_62605, partial [Methylobacterium radiotolerans]